MRKTSRCIIHGKRKIGIRIVCCIMILCMLSGCGIDLSRFRNSGNHSLTNEEQVNLVMDQVLEALNEHDAEQLTNLFSQGAHEDVDNLYEMSEEAVAFYQGTGELVESEYMMTEKHSNRGTIEIAAISRYKIETEYDTYYVWIINYNRNDFNVRMEGLYLLQIVTEEGSHNEDFKWKNKDNEPGIYIQTDRAGEN